MSGLFTQRAADNAPQGDGFQAGLGEQYLNNLESKQMWVSAKDFLGEIQSQNPAAAQKMKGMIQKAVGIGDIGAVRLVSLSTETSQDYNTDTVLYNMLAGRRVNNVTDFTHAWVEEDFGPESLDNMIFDPNGVPVEDNAGKARRTNTLTAIGKQVNVGLVSAEMIKKRGFLDEMDSQINKALAKIRRSANRQLIQATEDAVGPKFKMGGLFTRSTANGANAGAAALTATMVDTAIQAIVEDLGTRSLQIFATPGQAKILNDLLKTDFPNKSIADFGLLTKPGQHISTVYYSLLVGAVPVYVDLQTPAQQLLVCDTSELTMAGFTIGDLAGPWVIALAQTGMSEPKVVFDLLTLEDRLINSRAKITNLAS